MLPLRAARPRLLARRFILACAPTSSHKSRLPSLFLLSLLHLLFPPNTAPPPSWDILASIGPFAPPRRISCTKKRPRTCKPCTSLHFCLTLTVAAAPFGPSNSERLFPALAARIATKGCPFCRSIQETPIQACEHSRHSTTFPHTLAIFCASEELASASAAAAVSSLDLWELPRQHNCLLRFLKRFHPKATSPSPSALQSPSYL